MIQYNPKNWFTLIFQVHKSHLMRYMAPNLIGIGAYSGFLVYLFTDTLHLSIPPGANMHAFIGIVLGLVLVFRTNTAYERWWEGRKLFGALTNQSRNLSIKLNNMLPADDHSNRDFFAKAIPNFYLALKEHLRDGVKLEELDFEDQEYADKLGLVGHIPNLLGNHIHGRINELLKTKVIDGDQFRVLSAEASGFIDVMGACERILKTPIPFSYSIYIKKVIFFYLLTMPFSLITSLGYYTVPMVMFTTYVLAGIELLAEEIEDPFGLDMNDLDTDGMAINIRNNVREILLGGMSA